MLSGVHAAVCMAFLHRQGRLEEGGVVDPL